MSESCNPDSVDTPRFFAVKPLFPITLVARWKVDNVSEKDVWNCEGDPICGSFTGIFTYTFTHEL